MKGKYNDGGREGKREGRGDGGRETLSCNILMYYQNTVLELQKIAYQLIA